VTIQQIEQHKHISQSALEQDLLRLRKLDPDINSNSFAGNRFLYHHQFLNLLKCHRHNSHTLYDIHADPVKWQQLLVNTRKRNRAGPSPASNIFECFRINTGSVVMFKASTAKYLFNKYNAQHVLDPTAGWGGRMLGAWALGIHYTGIDTNLEMRPAYDAMIDQLETDAQIQMIWADCLSVDFSKLHYDFVLTSPPYINLEVYEHMTTWETHQDFYKNFFIPLWQKCVRHIQPGGHVCFNISPKMYEQALELGLTPCDTQEDLKQQMGQKHQKLSTGNKKQDKIYIWHC
jgi:hypothetical protein